MKDLLERFFPTGFAPQVYIITALAAINLFGSSMVWLLMAAYLRGFGLSMSIIGAISMGSVLLSAAFSVVGGSLYDTFGMRKLILSAFLFGTIILTIMGITTSVVLLIVLYSLEWITWGICMPTFNAAIADFTPEKRRIEGYGLLRIGMNIGCGLGVIAGGVLARISYRILFLTDASTYFICFFITLLFVPESILKSRSRPSESPKGYATMIRDTPFLFYTLLYFLMYVVYSVASGAPFTIYSLEYVRINTVQLGLLWGINTLMIVFIQAPLTKVLSKLKMSSTLIIGSLFYPISYLLVLGATGYIWLFGFIIIFTIGELICAPTLSAVVANFAPIEKRGRYMGFFGLFGEGGRAVGPLVGGVIMDVYTTMLWYTVIVLGLLVSFGYLLLGKKIDVRRTNEKIV
ncbi:MFS transporter [Candidatus Aerophobetes bacterium]|nr:MFS transporter [Candidatus Aerophobetes bacterium]